MGLTYIQCLQQLIVLSVSEPTAACPITAIAGNGTTVTVQCIIPPGVPPAFLVGMTITIAYVTPTQYNGTFLITSVSYSGTTATIQFLSTASGAFVSGGLLGTDENFVIYWPSIIEKSELRIFRDLDFVNTLVTNSTFSTVAGQQTINVPQNTFIVIRSVQINAPTAPMRKVSEEYIKNVWYPNSVQGTPNTYSVFGGDQSSPTTTPYQLAFGPIPDAIYSLSIRGTTRETSLFTLGQTNPTTAQTFISAQMPDLFMADLMVQYCAFQRNYGALSDDPKVAISWENRYQLLLAGINGEEMRKKFEPVNHPVSAA